MSVYDYGVIAWIFLGGFLFLTLVGLIQRRLTLICAGVLGAFGSLVLAAYAPNPW